MWTAVCAHLQSFLTRLSKQTVNRTDTVRCRPTSCLKWLRHVTTIVSSFSWAFKFICNLFQIYSLLKAFWKNCVSVWTEGQNKEKSMQFQMKTHECGHSFCPAFLTDGCVQRYDFLFLSVVCWPDYQYGQNILQLSEIHFKQLSEAKPSLESEAFLLTIKDHQGCFIFKRKWLKVYIDFKKKGKKKQPCTKRQRSLRLCLNRWPHSLIHYTLVFTDDMYVDATEQQSSLSLYFGFLTIFFCNLAKFMSSLRLLLRQIGL